MRVAVDATTWTNPRGYGRFTRNAVAELVELDRDADYVLFLEDGASPAELPPRAEQRRLAVHAAAGGSSRRPADVVRLARAAAREGADAFLFPTVYSYFPVRRTPTVVGVHDAITSELPQLTLPARRDRLLWKAKERLALRRAARVFTVSEASRLALVRHLGVDPGRVAVVPEAPDAVFTPRPRAEVRRAKAALGLPEDAPYVVYAAGIAPHKNLETLLQAVAGVRETGLRLVLSGALADDPFLSAAAGVHGAIGRLDLGDRVLLPGYLEDAALAALYSGATAAVVPSLAEGFGLPAVEAAACGAPVVLSDVPAHRETLDAAALFFAPRDAGTLGAHLRRLVAEEETRRELGEQARNAVAGLSWRATAERLRALVHEAAESGRA